MMPSINTVRANAGHLAQRAPITAAKRSPNSALLLSRSSLSTVTATHGGGGGYTKQDVMNLLNQVSSIYYVMDTRNENGGSCLVCRCANTLVMLFADQPLPFPPLQTFFSQRQSERNDMAYSLSFADINGQQSLSSMVEPSALMRRQLEFSQDQLRRPLKNNSVAAQNKKTHKVMDNMALPKTLEEIMRQKSRAIVVTETTKPFRVVDVNECWEGLCGFSFSEARGKTLGSLLKGPDTNQVAATGLVAHLLQGQEAGAVLTNYTKEGREFRNRIRVGPVYDESGTNVTHFVGVLEEIQEEQTAC